MAFKSMGVPTWAARQDLRNKDGSLESVATPRRGVFPIHRIEDSPHLLAHNDEDEQRTSLERQVVVTVKSYFNVLCEGEVVNSRSTINHCQ